VVLLGELVVDAEVHTAEDFSEDLVEADVFEEKVNSETMVTTKAKPTEARVVPKAMPVVMMLMAKAEKTRPEVDSNQEVAAMVAGAGHLEAESVEAAMRTLKATLNLSVTIRLKAQLLRPLKLPLQPQARPGGSHCGASERTLNVY